MYKHMEHATQLPPDEYLSPDELFELHKTLVDQANLLMTNSQQTVSQLTEDRTQDADSIDLATNESERDFSLRLAGRERLMLKKIRYAIRRIDEGEYGVCESCGEPITFKRLNVRHVATVCIDCKTQAEQLERRSRSF
jgi:DnaK suppressor protein